MHILGHTVSIFIMLTVVENAIIIKATQQKLGFDHCTISTAVSLKVTRRKEISSSDFHI